MDPNPGPGVRPLEWCAGVLLPWVNLATALYFGWTAALYLNRLQVGWGTFGVVMAAINVRHFFVLRRQHRELLAVRQGTGEW